MKPDNVERTYARRLVSRISRLVGGPKAPPFCTESDQPPRSKLRYEWLGRAAYGPTQFWRFDWSKTCRSKYKPHQGRKQHGRR